MMGALLLLLAIQTEHQTALQHEKAGVTALQAGQTDVAIREFSEETKSDPERPEGYLDLGISYMQTGNYGSALAALNKAVQLNPDLAAAHQPLGYALLAQGYATDAIPQFEAAKDRAGLGIAQLEAGDLPSAVANLQAAVAARPGDPDLIYYLARASGLLSKQLYDSLIASHPDSPRANQAMGDNYAAVRQTQPAEANYLAAIRGRPDLPGVHLALGQVYADAGQWKQAESAFHDEAKLQPGNAEAAFRLGSALLQEGDTHEAFLQLARADRLQPDMPETLYALGKAESLQSNYPAAEKMWNRVVEMEKTGELASKAHFGLATIYRKQGRALDAAREMKLYEETRRTNSH